MRKRIALLVTALLTVSMVFVMSASIFATDETEFGTAARPWVLGNLTLEPEKCSVKETLEEPTQEYSTFFEYTTQTDITMCLEIIKNGEGDTHKDDQSTYDIYINGSETPITEETAKSLELKKPNDGESGKYLIKITRKYNDPVIDPFIGISVKALPTKILSSVSEFAVAEAGTDYLTRFYSFTPSQNGGYEFTIDGLNEESLASQFVQIIIENKTGKRLNESVTLDDGQKSCKLRVYLYGNTEYIISVRDERVNVPGPLANMKYNFKMKAVSTSRVSITGAQALRLSSTTEDVNACVIHPFVNKKALAYYEFTAPEEGYYEFEIKAIQSEDANDISVEIKDEDLSPIGDEERLDLYSGEGGTLIIRLGAGESCYLQLGEMYRGCLTDVCTRGVVVRKHTHAIKAIVDGDHVTMSCPCLDEEQWLADYWLDEVSFNNVTYTGSEAVPTPKFSIVGWYSKDDKEPTIPETAYTVKTVSKNKSEIGKATAELTFVGEYEDLGTYKATFKIVPAGTTLKSVTGGTKAVTVKWAKQSKKTTGYQIQYSTSSKFSSAKTVTIAKNSTTSKKISKLTSNKTYYVRVRTYKTVNGTKYYSAWSDAIKAKTK